MNEIIKFIIIGTLGTVIGFFIGFIIEKFKNR
jgi:putative flippase GtrA